MGKTARKHASSPSLASTAKVAGAAGFAAALGPLLVGAIRNAMTERPVPHTEGVKYFTCIDGRLKPKNARQAVKISPGPYGPRVTLDFFGGLPGGGAAVLIEDYQHAVLQSFRDSLTVKRCERFVLQIHLACGKITALRDAKERLFLGPDEEPGPSWADFDPNSVQDLLVIGHYARAIMLKHFPDVPIEVEFLKIYYPWYGLPWARQVAVLN